MANDLLRYSLKRIGTQFAHNTQTRVQAHNCHSFPSHAICKGKRLSCFCA